MKKTLRATEIVKKLRSIEERYRTGQPSVLVFDVSETAKEAADMIEVMLNMISDIDIIVYGKEARE